MSLELIYVVRHGFRSSWSVDPSTGVYTASIPSPTGIAADPALTSHGVRQAEELAAHLIGLDPPIEAVYSSPYYRCLQTINPFVELKRKELQSVSDGSASTAFTIRPEFGLCEWFGSAPFDHPIPAAPEFLKAKFPTYDCDYMSAISPSRKGESVDELYDRVKLGVQAIIDRCDSEGIRVVVLCTHAAAIIALGRVLTGYIPENVETEDFHAFTCGLSAYRRRGRSEAPNSAGSSIGEVASAAEGWDCELDSDCSFLSSGEERGWKFAGDESFAGTGSMSQEKVDPKL